MLKGVGVNFLQMVVGDIRGGRRLLRILELIAFSMVVALLLLHHFRATQQNGLPSPYGLPSPWLLVLLGISGAAFCLILSNAALMLYQGRQFAPVISLLVGTATMLWYREIVAVRRGIVARQHKCWGGDN